MRRNLALARLTTELNTDFPPEFAQHRNLFGGQPDQTVWHGLPYLIKNRALIKFGSKVESSYQVEAAFGKWRSTRKRRRRTRYESSPPLGVAYERFMHMFLDLLEEKFCLPAALVKCGTVSAAKPVLLARNTISFTGGRVLEDAPANALDRPTISRKITLVDIIEERPVFKTGGFF